MVLHGNLGDLHKAALANRHGYAVKSTVAKGLCLSDHRRIASHVTGNSPAFREEPKNPLSVPSGSGFFVTIAQSDLNKR